MKVKLIAKWIYDNRRVIGGILGSVLTLCGLGEVGDKVTNVSEVL